MVGVPGKYKGCETCRRRRVKCDNKRPFCQKCVTSGRQCEGYQREMVFITGTLENKGRVASHPKKAASSSRSVASTPASSPSPSHSVAKRRKQATKSQIELTDSSPKASAWDDYTLISGRGSQWPMLNTALNTDLRAVTHAEPVDGETTGFSLSLPSYYPIGVTPPNINSRATTYPSLAGPSAPIEADSLHIPARYLAHLPATGEGNATAEGQGVFLFESKPTTLASTTNVSHSERDPLSVVEREGPANYNSFPNHHYFVRVYRPQCVCLSLLSRQETFLSTNEWMTIPWDNHPKSLLDKLFDIVLQLPKIFEETDSILPAEPTVDRNIKAQSLLQRCLAIEWQFDQWLTVSSQGTKEHPFCYWTDELSATNTLSPFLYHYRFKDTMTGIAFMYYWMSQLLFYRCIVSLDAIASQPVIDLGTNTWAELPPRPQIDITKYQQSGVFAANICRGLDSVLERAMQPDMVVAPMTVAADYYVELSSVSQGGMMEGLWLEGFRQRLMARGQQVSNSLQTKTWVEVATF